MEQNPELRRLFHDLESKTTSLKSGAKLLRECPPEERKELLALMIESANALLKCLYGFEESLDGK